MKPFRIPCSGVLLAGLLCLLLAGCQSSVNSADASPAPEASPTATAAPEAASTAPDPVESILARMSLREKVGQLFLIRPDALDPTLSQETIDAPKAAGVTTLTDAIQQTLQQYPAGGIVQFGKNLVSPEQITAFNAALQQSSTVPLFLSVDEEGGPVARLANHPAFDLPVYTSPAEVGKSGNPADTRAMGRTIGGYLVQYGFNMDFAPDADVSTNSDNPVIGNRAFSADAQTAAVLARGMADGLREAGILPVFKHFPGHGDTQQDSHAELAVTEKDAAAMAVCEWLPFLQAQPQDCIMVGHIAAPALTGDLVPATLSPAIVTGILREQLGFTGLVVTDSLSMHAITDNYAPADAALAALQAGCDLLLMPADYRQTFDALVAAVENGVFPENALDATVRRILTCKESMGLLS